MSNPSINRWGLNVFWYHFWYSDTHYASNAEQDNLMLTLVNTYLFYGITTPFHFFINNYWKFTKHHQQPLKTYFRFFTITNDHFHITSHYRLRNKIDCVFPMRIWILKFQKWVILTFFWFQPWKKRRYAKQLTAIKYKPLFHERPVKCLRWLKRLRTLINLNLFTSILHQKVNYYLF